MTIQHTHLFYIGSTFTPVTSGSCNLQLCRVHATGRSAPTTASIGTATATSKGGVSVWSGKSLEGDVDGQRKMKFMKLMGAGKAGVATGLPPTTSSAGEASQNTASNPVLDDLEKQFETSRMHTYSARGAGLGRYTLEPVGPRQ
eukprot:m.126799 g.126799  ORF g.126799 m.126799 type:complete len:144 (-) comp17389_c0_seq6:132-563(-)